MGAILHPFHLITEIYYFIIPIVTGNFLYFYGMESAPQNLSGCIILNSPTQTERDSKGINDLEERKPMFSATSAK